MVATGETRRTTAKHRRGTKATGDRQAVSRHHDSSDHLGDAGQPDNDPAKARSTGGAGDVDSNGEATAQVVSEEAGVGGFSEGDRIRAQSNRGEAIEGIITSLGRTYAQLDNHKNRIALLESAQLVKAQAVPEELLSLVGKEWNEQVDELLEDHRFYSLNAWSGAKRSKSHTTYKGWDIGFHKDAEFDITKDEYTWYAKRKDLPQIKGDKETLDYCHEAIDSVEERLAALAECLKVDTLTELLQQVAQDFEGMAIAPSAPTHELATKPSAFAEAYEAEAQQLVCLITLASDIKAAHGDCEQALTIAQSAESSALEHGRRCGELLLAAKAANGHGGWEKWRNENTGIASSTASLYQRVYEHWDEIQELEITSLKGADRHFRESKKQLKANPQTSAELSASPSLPPVGTKLEGRNGTVAEVVTHDGALAVVNSRDGGTMTSSRLTAGEIGQIYQAAAEKGDRSEVAELEQSQPKAKKVKVGPGHLRAIAIEQSSSAFKLLSGMKGNLPEEVDLMAVADALEEAIMSVLEELILGEEG